MKRGLAALGLSVAIVACSSFGSTDAPSASSSGDAGADGPGDLTGIPHAFNIALAGDATVTTGGDVTIPITITRGGAATGTSTISVTNLGDGLTAADVTVQESETTVNLVITATAGATQGARKLTVIGKNPAAIDQVEVALNLLVRGPSGTLDLTWGTLGVAALPATFSAGAMALQGDGKLVVASVNNSPGTPNEMTRLTATGATDNDFALGFSVPLPASGGNDALLAIDSSGLIRALFAAVYEPRGLFFVRVTSQGTLDPTTRGDGGVTGMQEIDEGYHSGFIGADAAGNVYVTGPDAMRRYSSVGKLDTAYGAVKLTGSGLSGAIRVGPDGSVVNLGNLSALPWHFSPTGMVTRGNVVMHDAAIDATGRVIALTDQGIRRYASDLVTVDPTFTPSSSPASLGIYGSMTIVGGQLVITGTTRKLGEQGDGQTVLARYATAGGPDSGFGTNGIATSVGGQLTAARPVLSTDGRLYVAGGSTSGNFIARYWP